jgi:HSP20 family protein
MVRALHRLASIDPHNKEANMRSLLPWRRQEEDDWLPTRELEEWHRNLDDLFSRFMGRSPFAGTAFAGKGRPAMETLTRNGDLVVRLDLPGVDPKEVDISVTGDVLTVKAERKQKAEKKEGEYSREEIAYGSLERSLRLPGKVDADKIKASYDKGVLEITMPAPKELAPKKVSVKVEAKK